ncbi:MAG: UDP-N-acetylglucosamine 1-carboxyvinyltransferase [Xanthomonadaceae bacterium]|nr:UDP-N-acetylglucosamine 1-carboxyvinyltransferase [Xanthomonadaceae bacterium]
MDKIWIKGGKKLNGTVKVSGSKNAALPILFSSLLTDKKSTFSNVPDLQDIRFTMKILETLDVHTESYENNKLILKGATNGSKEATYDLVRKMRASVLALGPLVARYGYGKVSLPGGCAIGARPINFHLMGLQKLGAEIDLQDGYVIASCKKLKGTRIVFDFPSVGATENLMMAAVLAQGETVLENVAREPEIVDLAKSLRSMGAKIEGEGHETILIQGVNSLCGASHSVMGDRIEAGTYLIAGLITGGKVTTEGLEREQLDAVLEKLKEMGAQVESSEDRLTVSAKLPLRSIDFQTQPFPGFPTDMQAQLMALLCTTEGSSTVTETIFENRFMHVPELQRMGADISTRGNIAVVKGVDMLKGAQVMATDLRASACLILAALRAEGETTVHRVYHLDRGYEKLEEKFKKIGADIYRIE